MDRIVPHSFAALTLMFALAGCNEANSTSEGRAGDAAAVAAVNAAQERKPPVQPVALQPLTVADLGVLSREVGRCRFSLPGAAGPLVVATDGRALLRIDGELEPLAADVGGTRLGGAAWQHYVGKRHALMLRSDDRSGLSSGRSGTIEVRDSFDRPVLRLQAHFACSD